MTKVISGFKLSDKFLIGTSFAFVMTMALLVGMPKARAESPNILVGDNMTVGATGQGVAVLQGLMSELGFLDMPRGTSEGYYGNLTKDAVARYQASRVVAPSVGYFGPATKIAIHQQFFANSWLAMLNW